MSPMTTPTPATTRVPDARGIEVDAFDRRGFVGLIAVLAMVGIPLILLGAALAHLPFLLMGLAITAPALAAVPIVLERRHEHMR